MCVEMLMTLEKQRDLMSHLSNYKKGGGGRLYSLKFNFPECSTWEKNNFELYVNYRIELTVKAIPSILCSSIDQRGSNVQQKQPDRGHVYIHPINI